MKKSCQELAPLLFRVAEREATPDDALRVARHVDRCTGCRIRLARERHLGALLADELAELPVDDRLVDRVMERLPAETPRRPRARRGLKLAAWFGAVGLALGLPLPQLGLAPASAPGLAVRPVWDAAPVEGLTQILGATIQILQGAAGSLATLGSLPTFGGVVALAAATTLIAFLLGSSAALGVAGHLAWNRRV